MIRKDVSGDSRKLKTRPATYGFRKGKPNSDLLSEEPSVNGQGKFEKVVSSKSKSASAKNDHHQQKQTSQESTKTKDSSLKKKMIDLRNLSIGLEVSWRKQFLTLRTQRYTMNLKTQTREGARCSISMKIAMILIQTLMKSSPNHQLNRMTHLGKTFTWNYVKRGV